MKINEHALLVLKVSCFNCSFQMINLISLKQKVKQQKVDACVSHLILFGTHLKDGIIKMDGWVGGGWMNGWMDE